MDSRCGGVGDVLTRVVRRRIEDRPWPLGAFDVALLAALGDPGSELVFGRIGGRFLLDGLGLLEEH